MCNKTTDIKEALSWVKDGDCIAISSAGMVGYPDYVVKCLEDKFLKERHPGNLTLIAGCGHGIPNRYGADDRFGHPGFLKRFIGSHPDVVPEMRRYIDNNEIEGYVFPQGVLNQLYRCSAAKQPGLITKIGIGTYIDPRQDGGKLNPKTTKDLISVMEVDGDEYLFYRSFRVNIAIFRATSADESGNITIEQEALRLEILEMALAAKASGGKVIVQVKQIVANGSLKAKDVVVPGELVDATIVCREPELYHAQTAGTVYSPFLSGEMRAPVGAISVKDKLEAADIICRRAAFELFPGAVVNIGKGVGAGVGNVAAVEGMSDKLSFTVELGSFGGTPQPSLDFSSSINATAYVAHPSMFDFYHGGGLDITFLGAAEIDAEGNVNVSRYGGHVAGQGGFIDISQTAKKVVFCTYFSTKGFEGCVEDGKLSIKKDGKICKFVSKVDQITFNGKLSREKEQEVIICTERAVFKLVRDGIMLTELAPGVRLEEDIIGPMSFTPIISNELKTMDRRIFVPGYMGAFA